MLEGFTNFHLCIDFISHPLYMYYVGEVAYHSHSGTRLMKEPDTHFHEYQDRRKEMLILIQLHRILSCPLSISYLYVSSFTVRLLVPQIINIFTHWLNLIMQLKCLGTSLVVQWLRIHLPMQGTWVWSVVREDPTCRGATKPVSHKYWAHALQLLKPTCLEPVLYNKRSHRNEKPAHHNEE